MDEQGGRPKISSYHEHMSKLIGTQGLQIFLKLVPRCKVPCIIWRLLQFQRKFYRHKPGREVKTGICLYLSLLRAPESGVFSTLSTFGLTPFIVQTYHVTTMEYTLEGTSRPRVHIPRKDIAVNQISSRHRAPAVTELHSIATKLHVARVISCP